MPHKLGLKLWSNNSNYSVEAMSLFDKGVYDFIELYIIPGSFDGFHQLWEKIDIPFIIHAPHFREGVNLASKDSEERNIALIGQSQRFADALKAEKIIVHPGIAGDINETARQLHRISDHRIIVENKPYHALDEGLLCNGSTIEEISFLKKETGCGFCLDVGHAICAANGHHKDAWETLQEFIGLEPYMYHLSDGDASSVYDSHKHFGKGGFDIDRILKMMPAGSRITLETEKSHKNSLSDFISDVETFRRILGRGQ